MLQLNLKGKLAPIQQEARKENTNRHDEFLDLLKSHGFLSKKGEDGFLLLRLPKSDLFFVKLRHKDFKVMILCVEDAWVMVNKPYPVTNPTNFKELIELLLNNL